MISAATRLVLTLVVLGFACAVAAAEPAVPGASTLVLAAKDDSWWKTAVDWLDKYASSKVGMIQIGVLAVLLSLYIITRKDGPK
jgi:hypothetical protein